MRSLIAIAAVAGLATAAGATPARHHRTTDTSQDAAVKALNERSLQSASTGTATPAPGAAPAMSDAGTTPPGAAPAMSDAGMAAPAPSSDVAPTTATAPTTPQ